VFVTENMVGHKRGEFADAHVPDSLQGTKKAKVGKGASASPAARR
jgi:ribosomal protein S19